MPVSRLAAPDDWPTLGWLAIDWIEEYLCHGPGDVQGSPIVLDDEWCQVLLDAYRLYPRGDRQEGRRAVRRAIVSRAKGRAKSELAGMVVCFDSLGPSRFAGWKEADEPVGRPLVAPFARCLATEEEQSGNTYDNVRVMLEHLAEKHGDEYRVDPGLTRTFLGGGGEIRPSSAASASKDGGKETLSVFDEALALDTPLPTPTGWTTMGQVGVGDLLVGADGRPTEVLKVTDVHDARRCFVVTFEDSTSVIASAGHLWQTRVGSSDALPRVRSTVEMSEDGRRFRIPAPKPWKLPEQDVPLDPYVLGLWLGDGDATNATISVSESDADELRELITQTGATAHFTKTAPDEARLIYVSLPGSHRNRFSPVKGVKVRLRELGLLGNKHVPETYLRASIDQRTDLVQGLMDSDGWVGTGGNCTFVNTNERVIDAFCDLARSLGQIVVKRWTPDVRSRHGGCFKVEFTPRGGFVPFRLGRKRSRVRQHARGAEWVTIRSIVETDSVPVRCVAVDAPDHLFLAGVGAHVTHNTHLYTTPELRRMHRTVMRNLAKRKIADPWALETTTMYAPGERSVAEVAHEHVGKVAAGKGATAAGVYFNHREGFAVDDWDDDDAIRRSLVEAFGDAAEWMDFDQKLRDIRDPEATEAESRRYWLNQRTPESQQWLDPALWKRRELVGVRPVRGEQITLGFHGAQSRVATALIGCRISDGHLFTIGVWERPPDITTWEVPRQEVDAAMAAAMGGGTGEVLRAYIDPATWQDELVGWQNEWGDRVLAWWTNRPTAMARALERFHTAIVTPDGVATHDGDYYLTTHIGNAQREKSRSGTLIRQPIRGGPRQIVAATAAALAFEARADAIAAGLDKKHDPATAAAPKSGPDPRRSIYRPTSRLGI